MLSMVESEEAEEDTLLLREAMSTLLEYAGTDRVQLEILTKGKRVRLELPTITTGYCLELQERLEKLVGEGCVKVEA